MLDEPARNLKAMHGTGELQWAAVLRNDVFYGYALFRMLRR
jgi:hypothetical protein